MMNDHYLASLEYDKILERLAQHAAFSASREMALSLRPSANEETVRARLTETTEAKALLSTHSSLTIGGAHDVRALAHRASIGARLQITELLDIRSTLVSGRSLRQLLTRLADTHPILAAKAEQIESLTYIIDSIARCLDEEGRVLDSASAELAHIRHESAIARERLLQRLQRIINADTSGFLQENIITERNGRYVVPLKAQFRGRIPGIIHDQSSSGATLFIEPLTTVDLNNRWHELQIEERREIERILSELSSQVGGEVHAVEHNVTMISEIDLALTKARYSFAIKGIPAEIRPRHWPLSDNQDMPASQHPVHLIRARHPLLSQDEVVPISFHVGGHFTAVLITGPNTGGKTVSLKTVGLLSAMSQAGLHIPASDGSHLPVFSGIYADIGDEQSIEQSLSTFSSHMTRIIDILEHADDGALVLLDELGAGTDPVEGAALAQTLIRTLIERRCLTVSSSHYSQLKVFAFNTPGVENASVEFNVETLSPTYNLVLGLPGQSNAFAIAARLGLDEGIIRRSRQLVSPADIETEQMLSRLKEAQEAAEDSMQKAQAHEQQARELEQDLRLKLSHIEEARRQVIEETRVEGREELAQLRRDMVQLRQQASVAGNRIVVQQVEQQIDSLANQVAPIEVAVNPPSPSLPVAGDDDRPLEIGDTVHVATLGKNGELVGLDGQEAHVRVGNLRLRTSPDALRFESRPEPAKPEQAEVSNIRRAMGVSPGIELHLRGWRADEVTPAVERYLNDAYLAGLPWVHIIHGKGTGVLKKIVRDMLRNHPLVASHRAGGQGEGGDGITVAVLHKLDG